MKGWVLVAVGACLGSPGLVHADGQPPRDWITPGQAEPLLKRLFEREPFLASAEAREDRSTLNLFFTKADYDSLRGNPILGYWDTGGFLWVGNRVAWDGVVSVGKSSRPITAKAWNAAFVHVARKRRLVVDKDAPIRLRGACVAGVLAPTAREPKLGVALEVRVKSPTGVLRLRFGIGKATIEDAIGASLDRIMGFALAIGRAE